MKKLLIIIFSITYLLITVNAQTSDKTLTNAWLEFGSISFVPTDEESGVGIDVVFKYQRNKLLSSLQYHNYIDRELAHGGFELFTRSNNYHAINLTAGVTNKKCKHGHVSISTGLGIFGGTYNNGSKFTTIGIPIEAAASINILPFLGVNMKLFTNINKEHSLFGFGMDIQLGKLRKVKLLKI